MLKTALLSPTPQCLYIVFPHVEPLASVPKRLCFGLFDCLLAGLAGGQ